MGYFDTPEIRGVQKAFLIAFSATHDCGDGLTAANISEEIYSNWLTRDPAFYEAVTSVAQQPSKSAPLDFSDTVYARYEAKPATRTFTRMDATPEETEQFMEALFARHPTTSSRSSLNSELVYDKRADAQNTIAPRPKSERAARIGYKKPDFYPREAYMPQTSSVISVIAVAPEPPLLSSAVEPAPDKPALKPLEHLFKKRPDTAPRVRDIPLASSAFCNPTALYQSVKGTTDEDLYKRQAIFLDVFEWEGAGNVNKTCRILGMNKGTFHKWTRDKHSAERYPEMKEVMTQ